MTMTPLVYLMTMPSYVFLSLKNYCTFNTKLWTPVLMGWIELIIYLFALLYICLSIMNQNSPNVRTALPRGAKYRPLGFLLTPGDFTVAMQRVTLSNRSALWGEGGDTGPGLPQLCLPLHAERNVYWNRAPSLDFCNFNPITNMARWEVGWWGGDGSKEIRVHGINALTWEQSSGRNYTDCIIHSCSVLGGNRFRGFFPLFIGVIITNT